MKKTFSFNLGNRGLLPEEARRIDAHNRTLQESAARHNRRVKKHATITVKVVVIGDHRIYRAASTDQEPRDLPLASRATRR